MSKVTKEEIESFISKVADEFDYSLDNYCPNDEALEDARDKIKKQKKLVVQRLRGLVTVHNITDENVLESLNEVAEIVGE
jgi:hypothetical protein